MLPGRSVVRVTPHTDLSRRRMDLSRHRLKSADRSDVILLHGNRGVVGGGGGGGRDNMGGGGGGGGITEVQVAFPLTRTRPRRRL